MENHYQYLDREFVPFYHRVCAMEHVEINKYIDDGMIVAHGDKCYSMEKVWKSHGIPFERGVAIYLLSYVQPWASEVRERSSGWVAPAWWVQENYQRFLPCFPPTPLESTS